MGGSAGAPAGGRGGANATGGSAGSGMSGKGGAAGSAGSGGVDCAALEMDYTMTLDQAQACNSSSGKDQCTMTVQSGLTCGCPVYVNPDNMAAVTHLDDLRKQAGTHCNMPCPQLSCVAPGSATCQASSGGPRGMGRCSTLVATPL
jgi:hypothetical protein